MGKQLFPLSYQDLKEVDSRKFETIKCIDPLLIVNFFFLLWFCWKRSFYKSFRKFQF